VSPVQSVALAAEVSRETLVIQAQWELVELEVLPEQVVCLDPADPREKMVSVENPVQLDNRVSAVSMVFQEFLDQRDTEERREFKEVLADQVNKETRVPLENPDLKVHLVKLVPEVSKDSRDQSVFLDHQDPEEFPDFKE
jgi:hypothetical protein